LHICHDSADPPSLFQSKGLISWSAKDSFTDYGEKWSKELTLAIDEKKYKDAEVLRFDQLSDYFIEKFDIAKSLEKYNFPVPYEFNYFNYQKLSENGPQLHQFNAFNGWKANDCYGLFEHATGTYKTATGLICADYFLGSEEYVVITTPGLMISENWYKLIKRCFPITVKVVYCCSDNPKWREEAGKHINNHEKIIFVFVNDSLWSQKGMDLMLALKNKYLLIADEAHNWNDTRSIEFMKSNKPLSRLALTAKLSEPGAEKDTQNISDFFSNGYINKLDLDIAIKNGFLRNYEYQLQVINISPENYDSSVEDSKLIWRSFDRKKRKLTPQLTIETLKNQNRVLVYTGPYNDHAKEMFSSIQLTWNEQNSSTGLCKKVTFEEGRKMRKDIIEDFTLGNVRALVAIKVLDEGVDLPISDSAIMCLSNESFRQWTQRRGRILRKKNIEDQSIARITDFVLDISDYDINLQDNIRKLYSSEVKRIIEFSRSSLQREDDTLDLLRSLGWII
jgi:superfamily II DNA or RNA helicase